jgi:hypothetical protein
MSDPSRDPEVPPPHRPLRPDEPPTPILPDPGEPGPILPIPGEPGPDVPESPPTQPEPV